MDEQERHDQPGESRKKGGQKGKRDLGLTIIGIGKLIKAAVLLTVGVAALVAVNDGPPKMLAHAANFIGVDHNSHHLQRLVGEVSGVSAKQLATIGFGSFVYAALFAVEGVGLLMTKRWAEYLTICITISFIPLEIYEIVHHESTAKIVTLALNVIVAVYLVIRVRRERRESGGKEGEQAKEATDVSDGERGPRSAPAPLGIASR
jgi:uncharacterized membrane protein (DUF2068 family)